MLRHLLFAAAFLAASPALAAPTAAERLHALADEMVEAELDLAPWREAHLQGAGPRAARAPVDLSPGHDERARALYAEVLRRLAAIDPRALSEADRINQELLRFRAESEAAEARHPLRALRLPTPNGGLVNTLVWLATGTQPLATEGDFEAWLARLSAGARTFDHAPGVLRAAAARGWTTPRALVEKGLAQVERIAATPAEQGPFWGPVARFPREVPAARRDDYLRRYRAAIDGELRPAMARFAAFLREEYLPRARTSAGLAALPGGERAYRALIRQYTTLALEPAAVHELGLSEVARVRARTLEAARSLGFAGAIGGLAAWRDAQPAAYPFTSGEQVIEHLRAIHARVEPRMGRLFHRLPKAAFEIRLVDPAVAASASATYSRPLADGSRPGVFRMPVPDPRKTSTAGLAAVLMHEGLPGHHLDIGRGIELDVPRFRKLNSLTVYSEGWGLYAESLGHELGAYDDPWSLLGRYQAELHRAARLVVDTGLHWKGWSRERAIRYLVEETGQAERNAVVAVERYMANPGQALAYKVGELEILRLRAEAERALGPRFDVRDFHEAILGAGQLTLAQLRRRVERWLRDAKADREEGSRAPR